MLYFLKRNIPIVKQDNEIFLGQGASFISFCYNKEIEDLLNDLTTKGVEKKDIATASFLVALKEKKLLTSKNPLKQLSRNNLFFDHLGLKPITDSTKNKKIFILGAGGLGSIICFQLAQWGFNNLTVVDNDVVAQSDIYKTLIYRSEHIGIKKSAALSDIIKTNFKIEISIIDKKLFNKEDLIDIISDGKPSLIVYAIDPSPVLRFHLNELAFELNIPYLSVAYSFQFLRLGPFCIPGKTKCLEFYNNYMKNNTSSKSDYKKMIKLYPDYLIHPSVSFNITMLGGVALKEIIFFFCNKPQYIISYNKLITINALNFEAMSLEMKCDSSCGVCGHSSEIE